MAVFKLVKLLNLLSINLIEVFFTECFVPVYHPVAENFQYGGLKYEIYPRHPYQDGKEEDASTGVEGENIGDGHQGQTVLTETLAHILGNLSSQLFPYSAEELLEDGSLVFLTLGIPYIKE